MKKFIFSSITLTVSIAFLLAVTVTLEPRAFITQTAHVGAVTTTPQHVLLENSLVQGDNSVFFPYIADVEIQTKSFVEIAEEALTGADLGIDQEHEELSVREYISCPFQIQDGRTIFDFTKQGTISIPDLEIFANGTKQDAVSVLDTVYLAHGLYSMQMATYRVHDDLEPADFYEESWFIKLFSENDIELFTSRFTRDMQKDEVQAIELVEDEVLLEGDVKKVTVQHTAYPNVEPQKIAPLCVAFDALYREKRENRETLQKTLFQEDAGTFTTKTTVVVPSDLEGVAQALNDEVQSQVLSAEYVVQGEKEHLVADLVERGSQQDIGVESDVVANVNEEKVRTINNEYDQVARINQSLPVKKSLALVYMFSLLCALGVSVFFSKPNVVEGGKRG